LPVDRSGCVFLSGSFVRFSNCSFFFVIYGDHRYLHSFPTRRSSDLTKSFLRQTSTGTNGAAPAWDTLVASDIPASLSSTTSVNGTTIPANTALPLSQNYVLNGAFDIWQRGTSGTPTSATTRYVTDRWETLRAGYVAGMTVSRRAATDASLLPNVQYCMRVQRTASNANTTALYAGQAFESINSIPLSGKTITVSFYARAGANYSSAASALNVQVLTGTGTDQNIVGGFTGSAFPVNQTATLTTSWQRFSYNATLATSTTQVGVQFFYIPVGTAGTNDYFEITGVQIETGSVVTDFRRNAGTVQGELAACQRHYVRFSGSSTATTYGYGLITATTTVARAHVPLPVSLRTFPTAVEFSTLQLWWAANATTVSAVTLSNSSLSIAGLDLTVTGGFSIGQHGQLIGNGSNSYIGISAEM